LKCLQSMVILKLGYSNWKWVSCEQRSEDKQKVVVALFMLNYKSDISKWACSSCLSFDKHSPIPSKPSDLNWLELIKIVGFLPF